MIRIKRATPQDDLLSGLVLAEENGQSLSDDELLAMVFLLLIAGHETTVNLIGNGMLALVEHPDQMQRLRCEPGLMKSAVEELLRFTSPVETGTERYCREDVTIAGVTIPRGSLVLAAIASANRDEKHFANPMNSISRASRINISPSAWERTTAWARRWRGWRPKLHLPRCCDELPISDWQFHAKNSAGNAD